MQHLWCHNCVSMVMRKRRRKGGGKKKTHHTSDMTASLVGVEMLLVKPCVAPEPWSHNWDGCAASDKKRRATWTVDETDILFRNIILQQPLKRTAKESNMHASANIKIKKYKAGKQTEKLQLSSLLNHNCASSYLICHLAECPRGTIPHRWLSSEWPSLWWCPSPCQATSISCHREVPQQRSPPWCSSGSEYPSSLGACREWKGSGHWAQWCGSQRRWNPCVWCSIWANWCTPLGSRSWWGPVWPHSHTWIQLNHRFSSWCPRSGPGETAPDGCHYSYKQPVKSQTSAIWINLANSYQPLLTGHQGKRPKKRLQDTICLKQYEKSEIEHLKKHWKGPLGCT